MGILRLGGFTAGVFAAALVAGCGRAQPPVVAPGAAYQAARQSDANASNYESLYSLKGPPDGEEPSAGLTGFKGSLYGTASLGGYNGSRCNACGTVYAIMATGEFPGSNLSEANGGLFGTTYSGGSSSCSGHCGVVFKVNASGNEQVVYAFTGQSDGSNPKGELFWTAPPSIVLNGVLYGTTRGGWSPR